MSMTACMSGTVRAELFRVLLLQGPGCGQLLGVQHEGVLWGKNTVSSLDHSLEEWQAGT